MPSRSNPQLVQHQSWLRRRARGLLSPRLRRWMDSGDLAQEAYLLARRDLRGREFSGESGFRSWLWVVLRNLVAGKARRMPADQAGEVSWSRLPGREPSPSTGLRALDQDREVARRLRILPEKERAVVTLRIVEELPFREISARLGLSEGAARVAFHRSIHKLRAASRDDDEAGSRPGLGSVGRGHR